MKFITTVTIFFTKLFAFGIVDKHRVRIAIMGLADIRFIIVLSITNRLGAR